MLFIHGVLLVKEKGEIIMTCISKFEAYKLAKKVGAKFNKDAYQQPISVKSDLAAIAKLACYRKPKSASGSTGRYFFEHLQKLKKKHGWK